MLRKLSVIAFAVMLAVSMMTVLSPAAYADDEETIVVEQDGFVITLWKYAGKIESVALSGYTGTDAEVKLPTAIKYEGEEYHIKQVNANAFEGNEVIKKVVVPIGYFVIGEEAFKNCPNLESIVLGRVAETDYYSISRNAFVGCEKLREYRIGQKNSTSPLTQANDPRIGQDENGTVYDNVTVYVQPNGNFYTYLVAINDRSRYDHGNEITINTVDKPDDEAFYSKVIVAGGGDPTQEYGTDGTPYGPGASEEAVTAAIENLKSETDPKGTVFYSLCVRASKVAKTSITLKWNKVKGAAKYVIYASKCGKADSCVKLAETTSLSYKATKAAGVKMVKGKYYKFIVVALDENSKVLTASTIIHVGTTGGKICNIKSVTTKAKKNRVTVKKGKSFALKGKMVKTSSKLKLNVHRVVKYVSTNKKVATVNSKGVIKGKGKGTCSVYAYAQNGVYKKIKVTVK